jgi:peroxiredoxin
MVMTASQMLHLGANAAYFSLPDTEGKLIQLSDFIGAKGLVVAFICNHCPYVIHIAPQLAAFVAINSNDTEAYPEDDMAHMMEEKKRRAYSFAYLLDEDQSVAMAYSAACTPDIYLFDEQHKLVYRGQFDGSRPRRISSGNYDSSAQQASGEDLRKAMENLLAQRPICSKQVPSMGCNIKWKPGNEPQ